MLEICLFDSCKGYLSRVCNIFNLCKILLFTHSIGVGWIRGKDPSRVLHYEGGGSRTSSTDIICPMYMRVWDMLKIASDPNETRPLILCE